MLRRRIACVVTACAVAAVPLSIVSPSVVAQEVQQEETPEDRASLIDRMADVAQRVSAKGEEVKGLEDELAESEKRIGELDATSADAQRKAADAAAAVAAQQKRIDALAQSRYRRDAASPIAAALDAEDVASAVERMGYLGALSKAAKREEEAMLAAAAAADEAHNEAVVAADDARRHRDELHTQRETLLKEQAELEEQQKELEEKIDALSPEEREAWINHFGGSSDIDVAALADGSGSAAVQAAMTRLGAPYEWGSTGPTTFDCSGLMVWSYQQMGKSIPRTSQAQIASGTPVPLDQLQPGDIVGYYAGITHVGMYIGEGQVVHASTYGVPVAVVPLHSMPVQGAVRY